MAEEILADFFDDMRRWSNVFKSNKFRRDLDLHSQFLIPHS